MTDLRTAAQQALEALEGGADSWQLVGPAIDALRAALAEPTPLEDVVTHGSAWSKDGKRIDPMSVYAEPVEPVAYSVGRTLHWHEGKGCGELSVYMGAAMNNDILRMAIEAGFEHDPADGNNIYFSDGYWTKELTRFAALVRANEREAIIDIVAMHGGSVEIEAAIRARSNT